MLLDAEIILSIFCVSTMATSASESRCSSSEVLHYKTYLSEFHGLIHCLIYFKMLIQVSAAFEHNAAEH